jgi:hypothetical protein
LAKGDPGIWYNGHITEPAQKGGNRGMLISICKIMAALFATYCVLNTVSVWLFGPKNQPGLLDPTTILLCASMILNQLRRSQRRAWGWIPDVIFLAIHLAQGIESFGTAEPSKSKEEQ